MRDVFYTVQISREGKMYVAYVPELDVSSCGVSKQQARKNIRDAVQGFLETSAKMGTLDEILEKARYAGP
jgi:predicted RNase H-like HicB family nuclease